MNNRMVHGRLPGLVAVALTLSVCGNGAAAGETAAKAYPGLPLGMDAYNALIQKLAAETNGNHVAMAAKLDTLGFTCSPASETDRFLCVRFGCRSGGLFWRGALLQWTVESNPRLAGGFGGLVLDHATASGCIAEPELEEAQRAVVSGKVSAFGEDN